MICQFEGCNNQTRRNGLCDGHSQQIKKHGQLTKLNKTSVDRFLDKVNFTEGCWEWNGSTKSTGYGKIMINKKTVSAHRFSYMLYNGSIPDGMIVRHLCHNKACVNPQHLEVGTHKENTQDSVVDGRMSHGERHPKAKLTKYQVDAIRNDDRGCVTIAKEYGVNKSTVLRIKRGETWKAA